MMMRILAPAFAWWRCRKSSSWLLLRRRGASALRSLAQPRSRAATCLAIGGGVRLAFLLCMIVRLSLHSTAASVLWKKRGANGAAPERRRAHAGGVPVTFELCCLTRRKQLLVGDTRAEGEKQACLLPERQVLLLEQQCLQRIEIHCRRAGPRQRRHARAATGGRAAIETHRAPPAS